MRKIVFIAVLTLLCFYGNAQRMFGVSAGYVPWGIERMKSASADELDEYNWRGKYGFANPAIKLAFERRIQSGSLLFELGFASFFVDKFDDTHNVRLGTYNIKQVGLSFIPGTIIMSKRRFQIPLRLGLGANYYFNKGGGPRMENNLFWDLGVAVQLKFYVSKQVAIYGGYSVYGGLAFEIFEGHIVLSGLGFKHYPEMGVLINFDDKKGNNKKQKKNEQ